MPRSLEVLARFNTYEQQVFADLRRLGWTRPTNPPPTYVPRIDSNKKQMDVQPPIQPPMEETLTLETDNWPHAAASAETPRPVVLQTATIIRKPDETHVIHNPQLPQIESELAHLTKSNLTSLEPKEVSSKGTAPSAMSHSIPAITARRPKKAAPPPKPEITISPTQRTKIKVSTSSTLSPVRPSTNPSRTGPPNSTASRIDAPNARTPRAKTIKSRPERYWDDVDDIYGTSPPTHFIHKATGWGTSQPARPPPINAQEKVTEWRLSARGNPQLASYPPTDSREFTPIQEKPPTDLLQANFDIPVPTKPVDPKFSVFDDLALLIPIDEIEVNVVEKIEQDIALEECLVQESVEEEDFALSAILQETVGRESIRGNVVENVVVDEMSSGTTIVDDHSSILAEFADASYARLGYEGLEYGCLSDSSTEFDWQDEKEIEYEGGEVDHLMGGGVNMATGDDEFRHEEDKLGFEEDSICVDTASSSAVSIEIRLDTGQFEGVLVDSSSPALLPPGTDAVEETDARFGQSETPQNEALPESPAEDHESQDQFVSTENSIPTGYSENKQMPAPLSNEEQSTPAQSSVPFAKIFAAGDEQTQSQETTQPSKGNNLRDFILKSGLFSIA